MDTGQGEKGLALPTPCKTFVLSRWMSNYFEPQAYRETTARVTHGILLVTAGRPAGCRLVRTDLAPAGCLAELDYGTTMVWNINCAK